MAAITQPSISGAQMASQSITSSTTTVGLGFGLGASTTEIFVSMKITVRTDGTYVSTLQGSVDEGVTFVTLKSGSNITAAGTTFLTYTSDKDGSLPPMIRIVIVSTGVTTGATGVSSLIFLNKR